MLNEALQAELEKSAAEDEVRAIKVVVWDLDHTIWHGVLLEDGEVHLRAGILEVIQELDRRGILQSVASKNDPATALAKLAELGIADYFLYPQISWSVKSEAVRTIAASINVGLDTLAFIDDQAFEREEVAFSHPQVLCLDISAIPRLLERPEFMPRFVTADSKNRRLMYLTDIRRNAVEQEFTGPKEEFLAGLGLHMTLNRAAEGDLQRAEELTKRTHQLNTTGYTYSYDELKEFMASPRHDLLIASLEDKYGTYGKIGLCLIERGAQHWTLKLLLMSCRVMSRGVGTVMMSHIIRRAHQAGVSLRAEFIRTEKNRMMYITYRFGNFQVIEEDGAAVLLQHDCRAAPDYPDYITVIEPA
ncbi:HAD-IIIC family phosphatase [Massilia sp. MB5]|uniref:HAD-IIIC family phosphatase n=1 Tax=Massilia sp. MB5 TaxID=2919578 RepID=UPI001F0DF0C7|nr:HAD-IIIC family phosphatase [Massilia sp. MB5]UMR29542.1 HAD-IIIC family phosphatase [Massilia sp. MB5]